MNRILSTTMFTVSIHALADDLIEFQDGDVIKAEDFNHNFRRLETDIADIPAGTTGPQGEQGLIGPTGLQGSTGPAGTDGADGAPGVGAYLNCSTDQIIRHDGEAWVCDDAVTANATAIENNEVAIAQNSQAIQNLVTTDLETGTRYKWLGVTTGKMGWVSQYRFVRWMQHCRTEFDDPQASVANTLMLADFHRQGLSANDFSAFGEYDEAWVAIAGDIFLNSEGKMYVNDQYWELFFNPFLDSHFFSYNYTLRWRDDRLSMEIAVSSYDGSDSHSVACVTVAD